MCVVSMVHDYGRDRIPAPMWEQPGVFRDFTKLVEIAEQFDKTAKQAHCEDPAKTAFMDELRAKHGAELDKAKSEADALRDEVRSLKRALQVATSDAAAAQEAVFEAQAEHEQTKDAYDALKIAYARIAIDAGLKVKVSGSGEYFTAIEIELPTGPVRFHIDNQYADLLAGLPYGLVEKGALDAETQSLRLTQAFNYDFDQALIPEPVTAEKVLSIFPIEPSAPQVIGDDNCGALVVEGGIRPNANPLSTVLVGTGAGVALPNLSGAARYSPTDVTMLTVNGVDIGFAGGGNYNPPGSGAGGAVTHSLNGGHVG